jgi:peptide/nickel transport system substrate-binding protein
MVDEYPVVPLWYGAIWYEYRTAKAVGWPSKENQTSYPDDHLLVITKLRPATGG